MIKNIFSDENPDLTLSDLISKLLESGPESATILEILAHYKREHPCAFNIYEKDILHTLGLFYKSPQPDSILALALSVFPRQYKNDFGKILTPVQASIRYALEKYNVVSISAPTSAGKSHAIRDYIYEQENDSVIVVPSRSLVDEYLAKMKDMFTGNKSVLVTPFVDDVFKIRKLRHIFVVTPERARDLFFTGKTFSIDCFFFDEAHLSEDIFRGVIFNLLVNKITERYPDSKIVFAHPFVDNPQAQISKFKLKDNDSYARAYKHGAVGRICVYQHPSNHKYYFFSPYEDKGHQIKNAVEFPGNFKSFVFSGDKTVLVYVSKSSIYSGSFIREFSTYIDTYPPHDSHEALDLIQKVEKCIGADSDNYVSDLVELMGRGVVVHHGSVPLEVRFLLEEFIHKGFARICFATSTLAQGVNMPFDVVWLHTMTIIGNDSKDRALSFKNLIGRSGRLSDEERFDYGYVFTKSPRLFAERVRDDFTISELPIIERDITEFDEEQKEDVEAIKNDSFDEDVFAPKSRVIRLSSDKMVPFYLEILDFLYSSEESVKELLKRNKRQGQEVFYRTFRALYECYINRSLKRGEDAVFQQAIWILTLVLSGCSFREITKRRYYYVSNMGEDKKGAVKFTQSAAHLPNSKMVSPFPLFPISTKASAVKYDAIVYDTYDYVDHVLSFSVNDKLIGAFRVYRNISGDSRADKIIELLRFGTNDGVETLLLRYGFPAEIVPDVVPFISFIDEEKIIFKDISESPPAVREAIEWYLP